MGMAPSLSMAGGIKTTDMRGRSLGAVLRRSPLVMIGGPSPVDSRSLNDGREDAEGWRCSDDVGRREWEGQCVVKRVREIA